MSTPAPTPILDPRAAWARLGMKGQIALASLVLFLIVAGAVLPGLARALLAPSADSQTTAAGDEEIAKKYAEAFPGYIAQFEGRSLFLVPGPMVAEVSTPDAIDEPEIATKPSTYGGPAVLAGMSDTVWFEGGKRLGIGQSDGDLKVVGLNLPWEVTLEWQEVEFKVGIVTRDKLILQSNASASKAIEPPPSDEPDEDAGEDEPADDAAKPATPPKDAPADVKPADAPPVAPAVPAAPPAVPPATPPAAGTLPPAHP